MHFPATTLFFFIALLSTTSLASPAPIVGGKITDKVPAAQALMAGPTPNQALVQAAGAFARRRRPATMRPPPANVLNAGGRAQAARVPGKLRGWIQRSKGKLPVPAGHRPPRRTNSLPSTRRPRPATVAAKPNRNTFGQPAGGNLALTRPKRRKTQRRV